MTVETMQASEGTEGAQPEEVKVELQPEPNPIEDRLSKIEASITSLTDWKTTREDRERKGERSKRYEQSKLNRREEVPAPKKNEGGGRDGGGDKPDNPGAGTRDEKTKGTKPVERRKHHFRFRSKSRPG